MHAHTCTNTQVRNFCGPTGIVGRRAYLKEQLQQVDVIVFAAEVALEQLIDGCLDEKAVVNCRHADASLQRDKSKVRVETNRVRDVSGCARVARLEPILSQGGGRRGRVGTGLNDAFADCL